MTFKTARLFYKLIRQNQRLAEKRHPMFEKSKAMRWIAYIAAAFWGAYLFFFGVVFGIAFNEESIEGCDFLNGGFIFFLALDFFMRFPMQETPAQEVKPYSVMPISRNFLIGTFLYRIGTKSINLFWLTFFVPFGFITIATMPYFGLWAWVGYLVGVWLLFVLNSYWYILWRTLINQSILYTLAPVAIYAAIIFFGIFEGDWLVDGSRQFMRGFIEWNALSFAAVIAGIAAMFFINRPLQRLFIYKELSKVEKVKKVKSREMSFLDKYGQVGEYLKLEIKSIARNATVRKQFITATILTVVFCMISAFTDIYDSGFMKVFIYTYCFACYGVMTLTNVMAVEGNYIDGLMSRKESVYSLLRAKYAFNCVMAFIPLLVLIAPICTGKFLVLEVLGGYFFTIGAIFPFLFQLAVYNNTAMPLNVKLTKQNAASNTKTQTIVSMAAMFVPMIIMYCLIVLFDKNVAGAIMLVIGATGASLNSLWLKNIYKRFMNHRYENMSSFRATR